MNIHRLCALATSIGISLLMLCPMASAQSEPLRAKIPFDFYLGDNLLPAGTYIIQALNPDVLRFRDETGKSTLLMVSGRERNNDASVNRIVFRRYGNSSFFANVFWAGHADGRVHKKTALELETARKYEDPDSVVVAGK